MLVGLQIGITFGKVCHHLHIHMPYDLAIPLLGVYPKRIVVYIHQEIYNNVYNIPFITPKNTENKPK